MQDNKPKPEIKEAVNNKNQHWNTYPGTECLSNGNRLSGMGLQTEFQEAWVNLGNLLEKMSTENTISEFRQLKPVPLDGKVIIFGQKISGRLRDLIKAKFEQAVFEEDAEFVNI